jgi:hypothetical protein
MKPTYFLPLLGLFLPTVVIGYGFVIPASCIAGINQLTLGFAATVIGACAAYWTGGDNVRAAPADSGAPNPEENI